MNYGFGVGGAQKSGKLGPGQSGPRIAGPRGPTGVGPGAQLSEAQLSVPKKVANWAPGPNLPRTVYIGSRNNYINVTLSFRADKWNII